MKKEVLLSLLMTTPVAFPALADVNLPDVVSAGDNGSKWQKVTENNAFVSGITAQGFTGMFCPKEVESLYRTLSLPKGTYNLSITDPVNCDFSFDENKSVTVSKKNTKGRVTITVSSDKADLVMRIKPINEDEDGNFKKMDWSFSQINFTLIFNFYLDTQTPINAAYSEAAKQTAGKSNATKMIITEVTSTYASADALKEERKTLVSRLNALETKKNNALSITDDRNLTTEQLTGWFGGYKLYNKADNDVVKEIKSLATEIVAFNAKAAAENLLYANKTANTKVLNEYTGLYNQIVNGTGGKTKVDDLIAKVDEILKRPDTDSQKIIVKQENYKSRLDQLKKDLKAFKTLLETTYPDSKLGETIDKKPVVNAWNEIDLEYSEIASFFGGDEDYVAYTEFNADNTFLATRTKYHDALNKLDLKKVLPTDKTYPTTGYAKKLTEVKLVVDQAYNNARELIRLDTIQGVEYAKLFRVGGASTYEYKDEAGKVLYTGHKAYAIHLISVADQTFDTQVTDDNSVWNEQIKNENAAMDKWQTRLSDYNKELKDEKGKTGFELEYTFQPESTFATRFAEKTGAMSNAIASLKAAVEDAYGYNLYGQTLDKEIKAIDDARKGINEFLTEDVKAVSSSWKAYSEFKAEVAKNDNNKFLTDKLCASSFSKIENLFKAIDIENIDRAKLVEISTELNALKQATKNLLPAFETANINKVYDSAKKYITDFEALKGAGAEAVKTTYNNKLDSETVVSGFGDKAVSIKSAVGTINGELTKIMDEHVNTMNTLDAILALNKKYETRLTDLNNKIAEIRLDYSKAMVKKNANYVKSELEVITTKTTGKREVAVLDGNGMLSRVDGKVVKVTVDFKNLDGDTNKKDAEKLIGEVDGGVKNILGNGYLDGKEETEYATINTTVKTLNDKLPTIRTKYKKSIESFDAYVELRDANAALSQLIEDVQAFNNTHSVDPAKKHYADLMKDYFKNYPKAYASKIETAYTATKAEENILGEKGGKKIKTDIAAAKNTVTDMKTGIQANHTAYLEQIRAAAEVRTVLSDIEDEFKNTAAENDSFNPFKTELDKINSDLRECDSKIVANYGNGKSADEKLSAEILAKLAILKTDAKAIKDKFTPEYNKAVEAANKATLNGSEWKKIYDQILVKFENSSKKYVAYCNLLNNGYKTFVEIHGGFQGIDELYNLNPSIIENKSTLETHVNKLSTGEKPAVLNLDTDVEYKAALSQAKELLKDVSDFGTNAETKGNNFARSYWTTLYNTAKNNYIWNSNIQDAGVKDVTTTVTVNGEETVVPVITVYSDAIAEMVAARDEAYGMVFGYDEDNNLNPASAVVPADTEIGDKINEIADKMDLMQQFTGSQLQNLGTEMWEEAYSHTVKRLNDMSDALAGFTWVTDEEKTNVQEKIDASIAAAAEVNAKAKNAAEMVVIENRMIKIDSKLNGFIGELKDAYEISSGVYTILENKNNAAATNDSEYKAYIQQLKSLETLFGDLCAYRDQIAGGEKTIENVRKQLGYLSTDIDSYKSNGYSDLEKRKLESSIKNINDVLIPQGYKNVANDEAAFIRAKIVELKNLQSTVEGPGSTDTYKQIDNLSKSFEAGLAITIKNIYRDVDGLTAEEQKAACLALVEDMLKVEKELSDIEIKLKGDNHVNTVVAGLSDQYSKIDNAIKSLGADEIEQQVKDLNQAEFDSFATSLEAIKSAWEAVGNNVVMQKENFIQDMDDLSKKVNAALETVKKQNVKCKAHNAAYDRLKAVYDGYEEVFNDLEARLTDDVIFFNKVTVNDKETTVAETLYGPQLANARKTYLQKSAEQLEAKRVDANWPLDEGSQLPMLSHLETSLYGSDGVSGLYNSIINHIYGNLSTVMRGKVSAIYKHIEDPNTHILPETRIELLNDFVALGDKASKAKITDIEVENYREKSIDNVHAVIAEAEALLVKGEENSFEPGDLDDDKRVNSYDAQELINLIGDRVEYEDLVADGQVKKAAAADVNGNGVLDAGDIVEVTYLANQLPSIQSSPLRVVSRAAVEGANIISTAFVSEETGVRRFAVNIQNSAEFVAGYIDLVLPEGMTLVEVVGADRAEAHNVALFHHGSSSKRVMVTNMQNAVLGGNEGAVIYVDVLGEGALAVEKAVFADKEAITYRLAKPEGTSGIEDIVIDNNGSFKQRIYNAAGQALRGLQRGVNIIRNADGSVSKEYHK